ncbi:MAG: DUF2939 domain-containing protein [Sphingomonas sp.]
MTARRWIIASVATLLLLAGGWYFGSPWLTLYQIRNAAQARDAAALSGHIDYEALRDDVRRQLRDRLRAEGVTRGRLGESLVVGAIADGVADAVVRPEGLEAIFAAEAASRDTPFRMRAADMKMRRDGFDQFRLVKRDGQGGELVFRRHGLGWKLAAVKLPADFRPLSN